MNKRLLAVLILVVVLVFIWVTKYHPSSSPSVVAIPTPVIEKKQNSLSQNLPKFNPETYSCDNMPTLMISKEDPTFDPGKYSWQVSAPRGTPGKTFRGDTITLGLRSKYGEKKDTFYFSVRVERPNGSANSTERFLSGDEWSYSDYPKDFNGGDTSQVGIYNVIYQIHGVIVACDGFVVE